MTRILANYKNLAMTSDNLALVAHFLDRRTYLHNSIPFGKCVPFLYYHAQPQAMIGSRLFAACCLLLLTAAYPLFLCLLLAFLRTPRMFEYLSEILDSLTRSTQNHHISSPEMQCDVAYL